MSARLHRTQPHKRKRQPRTATGRLPKTPRPGTKAGNVYARLTGQPNRIVRLRDVEPNGKLLSNILLQPASRGREAYGAKHA